jgi:hypothetical protein
LQEPARPRISGVPWVLIAVALGIVAIIILLGDSHADRAAASRIVETKLNENSIGRDARHSSSVRRFSLETSNWASI